jgi:hypothetical protein
MSNNSNYKGYLLRQLGIKESMIPPSLVERNTFPGIDPDELEMGAEDEKGEHHMSDEDAQQTAAQHLGEPKQGHYYSGLDMAKKIGMLKDAITSPTAIRTPIIGVSVRGSTSGGLPSGADQRGGNITPTNFGGYTPVPTDNPNSKLINKTPSNSTINSTTPIAPVAAVAQTGVEPHPHQVQNASNEPPQSVTGASTDSDDTLTLKSAAPRGLEIDVAEESNNTDGSNSQENEESVSKHQVDGSRPGMNETFTKHIQLMKEYIGKREDFELETEGVGASEPFNTKWKMDKEKAGMVKIDDKKLESIQESLNAKSKQRPLNEKELQLARRVNAVKNIRKANKK